MTLKKILTGALIGAFVFGISAGNIQPASAASANNKKITNERHERNSGNNDANQNRPAPPDRNNNNQNPPEPPKDSNGNPLPPPDRNSSDNNSHRNK